MEMQTHVAIPILLRLKFLGPGIVAFVSPINPPYGQGCWILIEGDIQKHIKIDYFQGK